MGLSFKKKPAWSHFILIKWCENYFIVLTNPTELANENLIGVENEEAELR